MERENKIFAFRQYANAIEANIAKTKLDAYAIPCFLTEENIAGLYPGQHFTFFSIRLHLFQNDAVRAAQILDEYNMSVNNDHP